MRYFNLALISMLEIISKGGGRIILIAGIGVLILTLYLAFVPGSPERKSSSSADTKSSNNLHRSERPKDQIGPRADKIARVEPELRSSSPRSESSSTQFDGSSKVGNLIANDALTHDELAQELSQIALDPNVSESDRLEAMEHGKNLGFSHLLPLSLDPNLVLPLAESYLNGLHRHDQPKEQVTGALGLLNHSDPEIRQQAQTLIGFLIGAEEDNESPDKLREKADVFLKQADESGEEVNGQ